MTRHLRLAGASLAGLMLALHASAGAMTVAQLQRLVQAPAVRAVTFQEQRESPWLSAPAVSRGTMRSTPDALEKRVEEPRRETWRLLSDRIEYAGPDGGVKHILFSQAPAVAPLADVMRHVVAGDFAALEREFRVEVTGDARVWRAQLTPRRPDVARHMELVELQGTSGQLQVIIVVERGGQRTTTRLFH